MNREDLMREAAVIEIPRIRSNQGTANSPRAWLREMPSVFAGSWDDEPIFFRRVGGQSTWEEADYHCEHTEAAVTKLKDMGVTLVTIDFFKGYLRSGRYWPLYRTSGRGAHSHLPENIELYRRNISHRGRTARPRCSEVHSLTAEKWKPSHWLGLLFCQDC